MFEPKDENEGKEKVSELLEFIHSFNKITDNYSDEPIQLEKELNNFYYTNSEKLINLSNYFNSIENSVFPPGFLNDYLPKNGWQTDKVSSQKDFDITRSNLSQLAGLHLQKISSNLNSNNNKGLEKGSLGKVLERIKQEKILEAPSKKTKFVYKKSKKVGIQLPDLPKDLKWEEITIRFLNGNEVQITARELISQTSFESMGFQNEKNKRPTLQWDLLKVLSLKDGYLHWDNNQELDKKTRVNLRKRKQELSKALKIYFHTIKGDPFFNYKQENGYKIKIQLIPEQCSDIKDTKKIISNNIDNYSEEVDPDAQDFFNEQMSDSNNW